MGQAWIDFDPPDIARRIEGSSDSERDDPPFGVIHLDCEGTVLFYSASEVRQIGNTKPMLGENFYAHTHSMRGDAFRGRIVRAQEEGPVDLEFAWPYDYDSVKRDLRIRVRSDREGGVWICIERDRTKRRGSRRLET
jgi:photoactive yellow protein